jgi:uncharacterized membrane protein
MSSALDAANPRRPRIPVLDFIRLAAIFLMIQGHTLDALVDPAHLDTGLLRWNAWTQLRGLTAPLFLMVSGAATVLGIRHDAEGRVAPDLVRHRVRMALMVMGLGYLLVFPAARIADLPFLSPDTWRGFLQVNILRANGVILLLLTALLVRTRTVARYASWSVALGLLVLLATPAVTRFDWFAWLPEPVAAYLSFRHGSTFPLFPFAGYMFLGVGLGAALRLASPGRETRTFRWICLGAAAACLALGLAVAGTPLGGLADPDVAKVGYAYSFLRLGSVLLIFGALALVTERSPRFTAILAPLGRFSLAAYVVHLLLLYGPPWSGGLADVWPRTLTVGQGALCVLLVAVLTYAGIFGWRWFRREQPRWGRWVKAAAVLLVLWELIV